MMIKRNKTFENKHILYFVVSPIGNLKDISLRAIEILKTADIIACEDTRNTLKLLTHFDILNKHLISLHNHNEKSVSNKIINMILEGNVVCYLSDAGYPIISDPGKILCEMAISNNISVTTIGGTNAALNALVCSNLPSEHFYFYGFLDSHQSKRKKQLESLKEMDSTIVFYEAPHRIKETILDIKEIFNDNRRCTIARELTKIHEEYIYFELNDVDDIDFDTIKGEIVLLVEGNKKQNIVSDDILIKEINNLLQNKTYSKKDIALQIAKKYDVSKNYIYQLILNINS